LRFADRRRSRKCWIVGGHRRRRPTRSDLLVINKTDLAPYVGADLNVMDRDSRIMRGAKPFVFTNLKTRHGVDEVVTWIRRDVLFET